MFSHDLQGQLLSTDHTADASAILWWGWNAFGRASRSLRLDACGVLSLAKEKSLELGGGQGVVGVGTGLLFVLLGPLRKGPAENCLLSASHSHRTSHSCASWVC